MPIEYYLRDYALTPDPGDYIAAVIDKGTSSLDDLAQAMIDQGCPLQLEEIQLLFRDLRNAAQTLLNEGCIVTSPLAILNPTIQGMFNSEGDEYDPQRHRLQLTTIPSPDFERDWQATVTLIKVTHQGE
jgi:hypothetical protein